MFICNGQDFSVQLLYDQRYHEVLGGVFLGKHDKDRGLLLTELLCINCGIKAQNLFKLRIKKCIQSGQCR